MDVIKEGLLRTVYVPDNPVATIVLAHGAGAGNAHEFMVALATSLCEHNMCVASFNFPYMQAMYEQGKRKPPNRVIQLQEHFISETDNARKYGAPIFVAGKSMGGRIASLINSESIDSELSGASNVRGCIVYGYPFIPPGKPEKYDERTAHLHQQCTPLLICQGERDTFGNKALLGEKKLFSKGSTNLDIAWINDGDHSFKPRKSSGTDTDKNIEDAVAKSVAFIEAGL